MNKNDTRILNILRKTSKPISCSALASQLDVTTRTIKNCISRINKESSIICFSEKGYFLSEDSIINAEESRTTLLVKELLKNNAVDIYEFSKNNFISDHTVEADITKIKPLFNRFFLKLRKNVNSYYIEGTEINKRKLVGQLLFEETHGFFSEYKNELDRKYNLPNLAKNINLILSQNNLRITEYDLDDLTLHIAVTIDRITSSHYLAIPNSNIAFADKKIDSCLQQLLVYITKTFDVTFPDPEKQQLILMLLSKITNISELAKNILFEHLGEESIKITKDIVNAVNESYMLQIDNPDFINSLEIHINSTIIRVITGYQARNPYIKMIKQNYPLVYEIGIFIGNILSKYKINLSEDELAYISFHFGSYLEQHSDSKTLSIALVLREKNIISIFVKNKIHSSASSIIKDLTIQDSFENIDESYNVIISNMKPQINLNIPFVYIPSFTDEELQNLIQTLFQISKQLEHDNVLKTLKNASSPKYFKKDFYTDTPVEMITYLSQELINDKIVDDSFTDSVLQRENLSGTVLVPNIALPHSLKMEAYKTQLSIVINKKPMLWNDNHVNIIILIAMSINDRELYNNLIERMIVKFSEQDDVAKDMLKLESYDDFIFYIYS